MDAQLFHFINTSLTNFVFDQTLPWFTNFHHTDVFRFFILPALFVLLFWSKRWLGVFIGLLGALLTFAADELCNLVLKPMFQRPRPFDANIDAILRIAKPGGSSFPSGHALDFFFIAIFFGWFFPRARVWLLGLAFAIAFSRVYNGVHYPGDVLGGALLGCALGLACALIISRLFPRLRTS